MQKKSADTGEVHDSVPSSSNNQKYSHVALPTFLTEMPNRAYEMSGFTELPSAVFQYHVLNYLYKIESRDAEIQKAIDKLLSALGASKKKINKPEGMPRYPVDSLQSFNALNEILNEDDAVDYLVITYLLTLVNQYNQLLQSIFFLNVIGPRTNSVWGRYSSQSGLCYDAKNFHR